MRGTRRAKFASLCNRLAHKSIIGLGRGTGGENEDHYSRARDDSQFGSCRLGANQRTDERHHPRHNANDHPIGYERAQQRDHDTIEHNQRAAQSGSYGHSQLERIEPLRAHPLRSGRRHAHTFAAAYRGDGRPAVVGDDREKEKEIRGREKEKEIRQAYAHSCDRERAGKPDHDHQQAPHRRVCRPQPKLDQREHPLRHAFDDDGHLDHRRQRHEWRGLNRIQRTGCDNRLFVGKQHEHRNVDQGKIGNVDTAVKTFLGLPIRTAPRLGSRSF